MKKSVLLVMCAIVFGVTSACAKQQAPAAQAQEGQQKAKVYFVEDITPESLIKVYEALGREAQGKVAVKISTGEQGGTNYLKPELIGDFVHKVNGTIVECNTAYGGSRQETDKHRQTIANHGFDKIAKVDLMDEFGETPIDVPAGSHMLKKDIVGKSMLNYDFMVVLSHFKGHAMGGFGGALKNLSIGCASTNGKAYIHTGGKDEQLNSETWSKHLAGLDEFKDAMAEAAGAVVNHFGKKILYINVINNLSVDCDCDSHPAEPKMKNVGIVASLDPVAIDQACVDMVFNSNDSGNRDLVERIVSRHGTRILYWAQKLNVGSRDYELVHVK
jgi:uncharacterized Fe-S center protein